MSLERFTRKAVVTAQPDDTVLEVARRMLDKHVGAVVVVDAGRPCGIITDRDLALRVIAQERDWQTPAREVMSQDLVTARVAEEIDDVVVRMQERGVRRLPILSTAGTVVGLVALDDLYVLLAGELEKTAHAVLQNRGP